MDRIVILGAGPVGRYIAIDLCRDPGYEVTSVDINRTVLEHLANEHPVQTRVADLSTAQAVTQAVEHADSVLRDGDTVTGVEAEALTPNVRGSTGQKITVRATRTVLAGGAMNPPAILLRSKVPDPHGRIGKRTFLHPTTLTMAMEGLGHLHHGHVCAPVVRSPVVRCPGSYLDNAT